MKYTFVVKPGADPNQIKLAWRGASGVNLNAMGELEVTTPAALPATLEALSGYESVVLVNVNAANLSPRKMELLQTYVRELGGGLVAVGGIVVVLDLGEGDHGAVVHGDDFGFAGVVVDEDGVEVGDEIHFVKFVFVKSGVHDTLGGAFVVIEGDTGGDDVEYGRAVVEQGRFDEGLHLMGIA